MIREKIKDIRPLVETAVSSEQPLESFQNQTLRPILKFQNDLLILMMKKNFEKRKNFFYQIKPKEQLAYIDQTIRKDLRFKSLLFGTIIGLFSEKELDFFSANEDELSRRLTNLLVQRIQSQVDFFNHNIE
jgi:hypothetical protein